MRNKLKQIKKKIETLLLLLFLIQLSGCYIPYYTYLRNLSDSPVEMTLRCKQFGAEFINKKLHYAPEILKINRNTLEKISDTLTFKQIDSTKIRLTIPPKTTLMLTPTLKLNRFDNNNYKIILSQNAKSDTLNLHDFASDKNDKFNKTGGLFVRNIYYFDYKDG